MSLKSRLQVSRRPQLLGRELPVGIGNANGPRAGVHSGGQQECVVPNEARLQRPVVVELPVVVEALFPVGWVESKTKPSLDSMSTSSSPRMVFNWGEL